MTVPTPADENNLIVGESLFDFLCLGYHRGYFGLANLPSVQCLAAYSSARWQPTEDWECSAGLGGVDEHERRLLDFLIAELGLVPWKDLKRKFRRLQRIYGPLLEIPDFDSLFE
jgi:hypothetical protein